MQRYLKKLHVYLCAVILMSHSHIALSDTASDAEIVFNWAEINFPGLFPNRQATQTMHPWLYRHYPVSGLYVGINQTDEGVYVLGGQWGSDQPTRMYNLTELVEQITATGENGNTTSCETGDGLAGIEYRQSGEVITVTSNGQCLQLPDLASNSNLCPVPRQTSASGVSMLSTNTITSSTIQGLSSELPGLPETIKTIVEASANVKHCVANVPAHAVKLIVNSDLCFDITSALSTTLSSFPTNGLVVTPPVTYAFTGTYASTVVEDCFATDAATIHDAFTGETWKKENGIFIKIGD